jgi:hypothetical protein
MARQPVTHSPPNKPHKFIVFGGFKKMNTKVARQSLPEDELAWLENLMPIGPNNLVTTPAALAALANIGNENVFRMYGGNIKTIDWLIIFTVLGAGIAINANTGAVVTFAVDGTFVNPDMAGFASQRFLIIDTGAAGYSTWDGTTFVPSGGVSPNIQVTNGGTFAATPAVTITGGSGVGATAHAVMGGSGASQFVAQVVLDTPGTGYLPGDTLTVVFAPASTAAATARVWPQVKGTSIAVFGGRVWWCSAPTVPAGSNVRILNFTGTNGFDDTNPANAAGSTTITDSDLPHDITALRSLNNYLYVCGDNSIRQIGSITVQSSITLFTFFTISSDIGTTFLNTILSYNRFVIFSNKNGVYGIFGATVQKLSDDMDGIFQNIDFSQNLSASVDDIHVSQRDGGAIHCYLLLVKYLDPIRGSRSILLAFDGKQWFVISQGNINAICTIPLKSSLHWETFAAIENKIVQLLQDNTVPIPVLLITSLSPHGSIPVAKQVFHAAVALNVPPPTPPLLGSGISMQIDTENGSLSQTLLATGGFQLLHNDVDGYGHYLGFTVVATLKNTSINALVMEYVDADLWGDLFKSPPPTLLTDETGTIILTDEGGVLPLTP